MDIAATTEWFAGPRGTFVFDQHLFSFAPDSGTSVWDIASGERLHRDEGFVPSLYLKELKQFVTLGPGPTIRLSTLKES